MFQAHQREGKIRDGKSAPAVATDSLDYILTQDLMYQQHEMMEFSVLGERFFLLKFLKTSFLKHVVL